MTAEQAFAIVTYAAMAGWIVLAYGVIARKRHAVERVAGRYFPLALCAAYTMIAPGFFMAEQGGFSSLAQVQVLTGSPWLLLGGWIHWLAADLFVGSWISLQVIDKSMTRGWLALLLPVTFIVGPAGFLAYHLAAAASARLSPAASK